VPESGPTSVLSTAPVDGGSGVERGRGARLPRNPELVGKDHASGFARRVSADNDAVVFLTKVVGV